MFECTIPDVSNKPVINVIYSTKPFNTKESNNFFEEFNSMPLFSPLNCTTETVCSETSKIIKSNEDINEKENLPSIEDNITNTNISIHAQPKAGAESLNRLDENIDDSIAVFSANYTTMEDQSSDYQNMEYKKSSDNLNKFKNYVVESLNTERQSILDGGEKFGGQFSICEYRIKALDNLIKEQQGLLAQQQLVIKILNHPAYSTIQEKRLTRPINADDVLNFQNYVRNIDSKIFLEFKRDLLNNIEKYRNSLR